MADDIVISFQAELMVTSADGAVKRQHRSIAEKRRIVEETFAPGASVALIARANGVNANQVFGCQHSCKTDPLTIKKI